MVLGKSMTAHCIGQEPADIVLELIKKELYVACRLGTD